MGHHTDPSDIRIEPDILQLGPDEHVAHRNRLRRFVEPGLLVVAVGATLVAVQATGGEGSSVAGPAASPSATPSTTARVKPPPIVAPQAAAPGELITVLGYRNGRLCGPAELRFDGTPVPHRLAGYVGPLNLDHMQLVLTMRVPRSATQGTHEIELYGPVPGGRGGPVCAEVREHQAELASVTMTVRPSAGVPGTRTRFADRFPALTR